MQIARTSLPAPKDRLVGDIRGQASRARLLRFLAVLGPGIVVMLADTDVGSIVTAAQSGVAWGYRLLLLQFVLIPILYVVQELTVRLGIFTGKGHGELIRTTFGPAWAWVSAGGLAIATVGALLSEFSGVAGVGELYGAAADFTVACRGGVSHAGGTHGLLSPGSSGSRSRSGSSSWCSSRSPSSPARTRRRSAA